MSAKWDVLGFGVVAVDDLLYVDRYPVPDTKVPVQARRREGGGLTGTALVAAARLGARAAYCGILGSDELSRFTLEAFEREGVDCSQVIHRPGAQPHHSIIIVDLSTGQRTILYSAEGVIQRNPDKVPHELIARCRVLFVDDLMGTGALRAVELARAHGIPTVGDVERENGPGVRELMTQIDHLIVGAQLAERVTGETKPERMVRALDRPGRICSVVTAGEEGCWYMEHGGPVRHFPTYTVQVVDTTGCGDVFHGAYAACLAKGADIPAAIQVATAAAALKATQPGGRTGIPSRTTVDRFIRENTHGG